MSDGPGQRVLVSACLLGERCRYDGRDQRTQAVLDALAGKVVIPICPEVAGGLGTPRPAVQLTASGARSQPIAAKTVCHPITAVVVSLSIAAKTPSG